MSTAPSGIWLGKVARVTGGRVYVTVERLAPGREFGPAILPELTGTLATADGGAHSHDAGGQAAAHTHPAARPLAQGHDVIVGFLEGRPDDLVVLGRL